MIGELILLALILILVYVCYKLYMKSYRESNHAFGMWYGFRHYDFPELDNIQDDLYTGAIASQYSASHYNTMKSKNDETMANFPTIDDAIMRKIANILGNYMTNMNATERAEFLLAFVQQNFRYEKDATSTGYSDYWKLPINTFRDRCGDCEDMAFMLVNLYYNTGLDAISVWVDNHMTVGVALKDVKSRNVFRLDNTYYAQAEATGMNGIGKTKTKYKKIYYMAKPKIPTEEFKSMLIKERN